MANRVNFGKLTDVIDGARSHRDPNQLLQGLPAARRSLHQAQAGGAAGCLQGGLPDRKLRRENRARFRQVRGHRDQDEPDGMPARGAVLCRAALRDLPPERRRRGSRGRCLHGRSSAHDRAGQLHYQRRRARHRQPAAPLPGHLLRAEHAPQRHHVVLLPHHPRPRLLDGSAVRHLGQPAHLPRPHPPPPQVPGLHLPARARLRHRRRVAVHVLHPRGSRPEGHAHRGNLAAKRSARRRG
jgi:hypothetical protein